MLVLSRKCGEGIVVDGEARFTILGIKGRNVKVGVEASGDVRILRAELESLDAASVVPPSESAEDPAMCIGAYL